MSKRYTERVELHCHSNKSPCDGVSSIKDIIAFADMQGMPAVAITDHGTVAGYEEAFRCSQQYKNMKIIYGIEAYAVDDTLPIVKNDHGQKLEDDYAIVNIETTGIYKSRDDIIEISAVKVSDGVIVDRFHSYVNIDRHIPEEITELTNVSDADIKGAPSLPEVINRFWEFIQGTYLVAHTMPFEEAFLKKSMRDNNVPFEDVTLVDTLLLSRVIMPEIERYTILNIADEMNIDYKGIHNSYDDAALIAKIFRQFILKLKAKGIERLSELNTMVPRNVDVIKNLPTYHVSILIKNEEGRSALFKMISDSELIYKNKKPRIPWSELSNHRENLIIGSACESGLIYREMLDGELEETIIELMKRYDYIEVQPISNNRFLIESIRHRLISDAADLEAITHRMVNLAEHLAIPVVATSDVHFLHKEDAIKRVIIQRFIGFLEPDDQMDLHFRTTKEMLDEFSFLGKEKAWEIVVENTNMIANQIESFPMFLDECIYPECVDADERLEEICFRKLHEIYEEPVKPYILHILNWELSGIKRSNMSSIFLLTRELLTDIGVSEYQVGFRGNLGASFVAFLCEISCINPIEARLQPEFFFGLKGDKLPDFDLNVPSSKKQTAWEASGRLEDVSAAFHAGSYTTVSWDNACEAIKEYEESHGICFTDKKRKELLEVLTNIMEKRGTMHPGGMLLVPKGYNIHEFTPLMESCNGQYEVTEISWHALKSLYKIDLMSCTSTDMINALIQKTGVDVRNISLKDISVLEMFESRDHSMEAPYGIRAYGVPEFNNDFAIQALKLIKPEFFEDLVKIIALSHGIAVWDNNAEKLLKEEIAVIDEIISSGEDIFDYLLSLKFDRKYAFMISDRVRKGQKLRMEDMDVLRSGGVSEWYIESCNKIKYLFPRAHAYRAALDSWWCAWFKLHYPLEFIDVYEEVYQQKSPL